MFTYRKFLPLFAVAFVFLCVSVYGLRNTAQSEETILSSDVSKEEMSDVVLYDHELDRNTAIAKPQIYLVAHAGAAVSGYQSTNSMEAINNAAAFGYHYIELDIIPTADDYIVLNHDWYEIGNRIAGANNGVMTYEAFMNSLIYNQFQPVDLDMLIEFLAENPFPRIITDTKDTDYAALYMIAEKFPQYKERFIPQAYEYDDVALLRGLGYNDVILTIYTMGADDREPKRLHDFAVKNGLYAVTIHDSEANDDFFSCVDTNIVRYMVHTIDDLTRAQELSDMGVYALYTDFIVYKQEYDGLTRMPLPVQSRADIVNKNLSGLTREEVENLDDIFIYKVNDSVYLDDSMVFPIWEYYLTSSVFINPYNGLAYFVDRHFARFMQAREYDPDMRTLFVTVDGYEYEIGKEVYEDLVIYRDMLYISENTVKKLFDFDCVIDGEYIILVPAEQNGYDITMLFELAGNLFS